jgi:hypothetical protein
VTTDSFDLDDPELGELVAALRIGAVTPEIGKIRDELVKAD